MAATTAADEIIQSFVSLNIPKTHATVGFANVIANMKHIRTLFTHRRLPTVGWSDFEIQWFLSTLAMLDTNQKGHTTGSRWCGVGEREGRVYSALVAQRHYGFSHGVGRSGDLSEAQPKAAGSSVLHRLAVYLALDAVRRGSGLTMAKSGAILPLCTGMSMALVLSSLRDSCSSSENRKKTVVLWSRIDQKSCFKAVTAAGLQCVVVPTRLEGDAVVTDLDALRSCIDQHGDNVLAVISTTSCFAPRVPDAVDKIAQLLENEDYKGHNIAHVINHAYGLQCAATCKLINRANTIGRVDAVVCSTDKNFMVPVGGALVLSSQATVTEQITKVYAGRASGTPMMDLCVTLLSMGLAGYQKLLSDRMAFVKTFPDRLRIVAEKHGERVLQCPGNTISFGMTLDSIASGGVSSSGDDSVSMLGAMLFSRCVSGTRVITRQSVKVMGGHEFLGFGSSHHDFPHSYMTAAVAIGLTEDEIEEFLKRLDKTIRDYKKKKNPGS